MLRLYLATFSKLTFLNHKKMKKIYLLALSVCAVLTAAAQYKYAPTSLGRQPMRGEQIVEPTQLPEDRVTIYTNDFSVCNDWTKVNANADGYPAYIAGINFECSTTGPTGPAAIDPIASPTAANGFMMVDSDLFGGSAGGTWVENCWFQNAVGIDCSGASHVSLKFDTFYRMWDNGSSDGSEYCLVEVSNDGITWPDINTFEVSEAPAGTRFELWPTMGTQDPVSNPTLKVFDISAMAAGETTVYLRFRWKGTWGYAWMVDDIELFETPESDITVNKGYNGDILNSYEYYMTPVSQVVDMTFGANVANYGYTDQINAPITFAINNGPTVTAIIDTLFASSIDTAWTAPFAVPNTVGVYDYTVSVPADDFPEGDSFTGAYEISPYVYSQATNECAVQRGFDQDVEIAIGTVYEINADAQAYGVQVWFGPATDAQTVVQAFVYQIDNGVQTNTFVGQSEEWTLTTEIDNGFHNFPIYNENFDGPVDLVAGVTYIVEIRKIEENSNRMYIRADVLDEDVATVCYGPFGAGSAINWWIGWSFTPAVRLNLDPAAGVGETISTDDMTLGQNMPNPSTGMTNISYSIKTPSRVQFVVRDISGRIVKSEDLGSRGTGKYTINLNTDELGSGIYSYTLVANGTQITKKMVVR
jgi:Secretion system C-terminal sorting domain